MILVTIGKDKISHFKSHESVIQVAQGKVANNSTKVWLIKQYGLGFN